MKLRQTIYFFWPKLGKIEKEKMCLGERLGGVLNFHFGMSVRPEGPKIGLREQNAVKFRTKFEVLKNWFFVQFEALGT